jgi:hypothetical protein
MAREDWEWGDGEFWGADPSPDLANILYGDDRSIMDEHAQQLMMDAIIEGNDNAYAELVEYMWDEYGIDFEDAWDWEDFKAWYESQ